MKKQFLLVLIAISILLGGFIFWLNLPEDKKTTPKKNITYYSKWDSLFRLNDKNPNGLYLFKQLAQSYTNKKIDTSINQLKHSNKANYFYIGDEFGLSDSLWKALLKKTENGSTIVIASNHLSENIYTHFFNDEAYNWYFTNKIALTFKDTTRTYYGIYQNDTLSTDWYSFDTLAFIQPGYKNIVSIDQQPVAFSLEYGKGKLILHSIPELFTNIQLKRKSGFEQAVCILEQLDKNLPIKWMQYAQNNGDISNPSNATSDQTQGSNSDGSNTPSPLSILLKNTYFRLAFILSVLTLILFLFFRIKRRVPIVLGSNLVENTNESYLNSLTQLFLAQRNNNALMVQLRKNCYALFYRKFGIDLNNTSTYEATKLNLISRLNEDQNELELFLKTLKNTKELITTEQLNYAYSYSRKIYTKIGLNPTERWNLNHLKSMIYGRRTSLSLCYTLTFISLLSGLYLLTKGNDYGSILLLIAAVLFALSVYLIQRPLFLFNADHFLYYPLFKNEVKIEYKNLKSIDLQKNKLSIKTYLNQHIQLNASDLQQRSRHTLAQIIEQLKAHNYGQSI